MIYSLSCYPGANGVGPPPWSCSLKSNQPGSSGKVLSQIKVPVMRGKIISPRGTSVPRQWLVGAIAAVCQAPQHKKDQVRLFLASAILRGFLAANRGKGVGVPAHRLPPSLAGQRS